MTEWRESVFSGDARPLFRLLPLVAAGLALLFLLAHFSLKPVVGDEGVTGVDAWRLLRGETAQRDYFEIIPPLSAGLLSWSFRLLGVSVLGLRATAMLYGVLLLLLTWAAARRSCEGALFQSLPLAVLVPFGVGAWPIPSHHWLADLWCLAALLTLVRATESPRVLGWSSAAGACLAGACFTLQDQGGLALIAALLPLPWVLADRRGRYLFGIALGGVAVSAAVLLLWLPLDPQRLWHDWFLFPATHYRAIPDNTVGLLDGLRLLGRQWTSEAFRIAPLHAGFLALASTLLFLLPFVSVPAAWTLWRRRERPRPEVLLLIGFSAVFLGTALHRFSMMNLIWAAPLPTVLVAAALDRPRGGGGGRGTRWVLTAAAVAVFLLAGALRLAFVLSTPGSEVRSAAGTYRTFNSTEARALDEFLSAVEARVPTGEGAFVRGFIPLTSLLTQRPNPTPFTYYQPSFGYHTAEQAERWCRSLEENRVRWGFSLDVPPDPRDPADLYVASHYRPVWRNGSYCLLERLP